jgi:hypothetical protein
MVSCKLKGRTGNQLFQIAAAIGAAVKNNTYYGIPQVTTDPKKWPAVFSHLPKVAHLEMPYLFIENGFQHNPIVKGDEVCIDGYFQSEKYFAHCREEVLKAFAIPYIKDAESVSVHVRRGDYLTLPDHHPVLPLDYYRRSIFFFKKMGFTHFKIFSDDMQWCRENINSSTFGNYIFDYIESNTPLGDLSAMSSCAHNIIANSSFSWWGAWLNQNPKKIVISPHRFKWFGHALNHLDTQDLIPAKWITLLNPSILP